MGINHIIPRQHDNAARHHEQELEDESYTACTSGLPSRVCTQQSAGAPEENIKTSVVPISNSLINTHILGAQKCITDEVCHQKHVETTSTGSSGWTRSWIWVSHPQGPHNSPCQRQLGQDSHWGTHTVLQPALTLCPNRYLIIINAVQQCRFFNLNTKFTSS